MLFLLTLTIITLSYAGAISTALDDYLATPDLVFKWRYIPNLDFNTLAGNKAYVLKVTSL